MKRKLNNKELESIGKAIFKSEPMSAVEIDRIVLNTELFESIKRRIAQRSVSAVKPISGVFAARRYAYASVGMAVTFAVVFALVVFSNFRQKPDTVPVRTAVNQVPDAVPDKVAGLGVPPQPNTGKLPSSPATKSDKNEPRYEQAIVRTTTTPRRRPEAETATSDKFFPVSYTGDPLETAGGGQVIRVEMKRSSLFALGVDLPLENDDAVVKADLLVGRDGVTRAVRLVD